MANKKDLLKDLSYLLKLKKPFKPKNLSISKQDLEDILKQLRDYRRPHNFKPRGIPPKRAGIASEIRIQYRLNMTKYIKTNTGIEIPVIPLAPCRLYNSISDYLGL